ncbi:MAG: phosphatidylglycerophosphatase A [Desulfobacteraceae bacterium]|nr:phosphatidylglycerophosphatase A [Desulfobacteraceae bacterium]
MTFIDKVIIFAATGAWVGKIPIAPGTFGTLTGILFVLIFKIINPCYETLYVVALIIFAIWIADMAEKILKQKDPGCIVIDEIAGYVVTMAGISLSIYTIIAGFILFRFFDIIKPFPVKYFERKFKGGPGIVLDDLVAGLLSAFVLRILIKFNILA